MSAYNILNVSIKCSSCKNKYTGKIQFKFGDTWQLQYNIGEKIKWGGNDIGLPNLPNVKVYGILENEQCSICEHLNSQNEFDIIIKNDIIIEVESMHNYNDYLQNEGNYAILKG